ncbi:single-stranded DNA-binding protein [Chloroflexota bacterium]|nr:single-stranded DNA-binding protein [Chloroflexota bacterium]
MSYQRILVRGNIGSEPRIKEFAKGDSVCNFSIAVNESYTNRSGKKVPSTTWFQCAAWNAIGKNIHQYKHKGEPIFIEGKMIFNKGNDGNIYPQIIVQTVDFIGGIQQELHERQELPKMCATAPEDEFLWND